MVVTDVVISTLKTMADGSLRLQVDVIGDDKKVKFFCLDRVQSPLRMIVGDEETIKLIEGLIKDNTQED